MTKPFSLAFKQKMVARLTGKKSGQCYLATVTSGRFFRLYLVMDVLDQEGPPKNIGIFDRS